MSGDSYLDRLVDKPALRSLLTAQLGETDQFEVDRVDAGHSNETLFVTWGSREIVVRRPPPGQTAETAHDVLREHTVISSLYDTDVPVPETLFACKDHQVLGSDFYVMERLDGDVVRTAEPKWLAHPDSRHRASTELIDTLAAIHKTDYNAVGLEEFGRPDGFTQRQVDRWQKQFEWAQETTADYRSLSSLERITDWLQTNVPDDHPSTLVHGDFKLDNVMFTPKTDVSRPGEELLPRIVAVFDWELSTLGDPYTDLGWMLSFWQDTDDPDPPVPGLYPTLTTRQGYLDRRSLIERYEKRTGFEFTDSCFYVVLATYKMGALGEMFFRRHLEGNSDDSLYPLMEDGVPRLLKRATRIIDGKFDI